MKLPMRRKRTEVTQICGVADEILFQFIQEEWVHPIDAEFDMFDDEDIARIMFIQELRERLGVNDEAVPVILHLVDQLNYIIQKSENNLNFKKTTSSESLGDHQ